MQVLLVVAKDPHFLQEAFMGIGVFFAALRDNLVARLAAGGQHGLLVFLQELLIIGTLLLYGSQFRFSSLDWPPCLLFCHTHVRARPRRGLVHRHTSRWLGTWHGRRRHRGRGWGG